MWSIIPPTVKSVGAAIVTPKPPSFFRIKFATGGGGARRALTDLGSNNAQVNLNMAQSHLAMAQELFTSRWNFNPLKEVPVAPGRYQWASLDSVSEKKSKSKPSENVTKDLILLKDITNPIITSSPPQVVPESTNFHKTSQEVYGINCTVPTSVNNQENSENEAKPEIIAGTKKNATPGSQKSVTDFFRPQKRKPCNQYEDCQLNTGSTPPKKKLRTVH